MTSTMVDGGGPEPGSSRPPWPGLASALLAADRRVVEAWSTVTELAAQGAGSMGLAAGDRPVADVEVLGASLAAM